MRLIDLLRIQDEIEQCRRQTCRRATRRTRRLNKRSQQSCLLVKLLLENN